MPVMLVQSWTRLGSIRGSGWIGHGSDPAFSVFKNFLKIVFQHLYSCFCQLSRSRATLIDQWRAYIIIIYYNYNYSYERVGGGKRSDNCPHLCCHDFPDTAGDFSRTLRWLGKLYCRGEHWPLTSGLPKIRQPAVFVLPCHGWTVGVTATHATKMQIRKWQQLSTRWVAS